MNYDPIIRPHAAAEYLGISRATLYRLIERGQLPAPFKVSRSASGWRKSQLDDFIERCQISAA